MLVALKGEQVAGMVSLAEREHFTGSLDAYVGELVIHSAMEGCGAGQGPNGRSRGVGDQPRAHPDHPRDGGT